LADFFAGGLTGLLESAKSSPIRRHWRWPWT